MAESSIVHASRYKSKHNHKKERHRDKYPSSQHNDYYCVDDNRSTSSKRGHNDFPREYEHEHPHRFHDGRRSPKHDLPFRTSPPRYEEHRSRNSFDVERFKDRSENRENVSSANRIGNHQTSFSNNDSASSLFDKINHLSSQVEYLTQENEKLRYSLDERNGHLQNPNSDVNIIFKDKYLERKFLPCLEELVFQLMIGNVSIEEVQHLYSKDLSEEGNKSSRLPEGDLFAVDNSTAEPSDELTIVPRYDTSFSEVLQKEGEAVNKSEVKTAKFQSSCFNCGGNHMIRDCPQRIDPQKVAHAKKSFRSQAPKGRYHCHNNVESVFKPGVISKELRQAMDLSSDQIPPFIYRMRILDYPPGWLEEATVESSGISLYGADGKSQKDDSEESVQRGNTQVQYDPSKFIDYPGFNVPLPPNIIDQCDELRMPPMQPHQMRSFVEKNITTKVFCPKRKRKLDKFDNKPTKFQRVEEDMEIGNDSDTGSVEFIPPLPTEDPPPPPPPEFIVLSDTEDSNNSGTNTPLSDTLQETLAQRLSHSTPSLRDLEELKKQLVQELDMDSGSSSPQLPQEDSTDDPFRPLQRTDNQSSKLVALGTPSLSRHSSFQKLPEYDNFAKDVATHLNFENLPNSTGAYQKMKKILKKVKSKIGSMV